jgi:NAD+ kinase
MNNFYIVTNETKDENQAVTRQIKDFLSSRGKSVSDAPEEVDCILVLGGDGTMLRAATDLAHVEAPFLGINLGKLGFLAEVDKDHIEPALEQLIADNYSIEKRMMLDGVVNERDDSRHSALNDVVIAGKKSMQLIYFDLYVNGLMLASYGADGMIVSTPTGSTGYNLSAGGPLVEPNAEAFLLTPVCSHSLHSRSIVLAPKEEVAFEIGIGKYGETQEVEAIFDGRGRLAMKSGDRLRITKSGRTTAIVKLSKTNFLEILKQKL